MTVRINELYNSQFDIADVALSGDYNDLINLPSLGTASTHAEEVVRPATRH